MTEHEFYADPTVFDVWQERTGGWVAQQVRRLRPFAWSSAFYTLAVSFLAIALVVLVCSVYQRVAGAVPPSWNQSCAQWLTMLLALLFGHGLFEQAARAWPRDRALPLRRRARGGSPAGRVHGRPAAVQSAASNAQQAATVEETRLFFVGTRAAGVNVAIARALFAARIRSVSQLHAADDAQLLQIPGVGPATVRRLRAWFSQNPARHPALPLRRRETGSSPD
jgi:hypothetical protein